MIRRLKFPSNWGALKLPVATPTRIMIAARSMSVKKFAAGPRQCHPRRTPRVALLPFRIEWRIRPADHPAAHQKRQDGDYNHAERRATNVRNWIERRLAALGCGKVTAQFGNHRVRCFMARRRKQKIDVPDGAEGNIRSFHRQIESPDVESLGSRPTMTSDYITKIENDWSGSGAWTRTRIPGSKGPCATDCTTPE